MARIGRLPSVPDEFLEDVLSTSWSVPTEPDVSISPPVSVRGQPLVRFAADCPSCERKLVFDVPPDRRPELDRSVKRSMRRAAVTDANTPLWQVPELLLQNEARCLVVVDELRRPLGILTPTHVMRAVRTTPSADLSGWVALDAATSGGGYFPERTSLRKAMLQLAQEDRDLAVVIDVEGRVAGILTATDVLRELAAASGE